MHAEVTDNYTSKTVNEIQGTRLPLAETANLMDTYMQKALSFIHRATDHQSVRTHQGETIDSSGELETSRSTIQH